MPLKDIVKTYATNQTYVFNYGTRPYVDWEVINKDIKNGQTIINMLPEIERGLYATNKPNPSQVEYSVFLQVARKWDSGNVTHSNLDETYEQKYDRRLVDLYEDARAMVKGLACQENWEMVSYTSQAEINQYSSNIELISVEFVFRTSQYII